MEAISADFRVLNVDQNSDPRPRLVPRLPPHATDAVCLRTSQTPFTDSIPADPLYLICAEQ